MSLLPKMSRLPYALARCSLPLCPRQAAYIGGQGFKLCDRHATMFKLGRIAEDKIRSKDKKFNLEATGDLDESGNIIDDRGE